MDLTNQLYIYGLAALLFSIVFISAVIAVINTPSIKLRHVIMLSILALIGIGFCVYLSVRGPIAQLYSGLWSIVVFIALTIGIFTSIVRNLKKGKLLRWLLSFAFSAIFILSSALSDYLYIKKRIRPIEQQIYQTMEKLKPINNGDLRYLVILPYEYLDAPALLTMQYHFAPPYRYSLHQQNEYLVLIWQNDYPNIIQNCEYFPEDGESGSWSCDNLYLYSKPIISNP